jgi:two-component system chemotaxis response regulator CheB
MLLLLGDETDSRLSPNGQKGFSMANRDIIVIGTSAGGVEALRTVVRGLPGDLPASIFIVIHTMATGPRLLAAVLNEVTELRVTYAVSGELIERGHVYVAPPNRHLLVNHGVVELSRGPRENRCRPAADPLFRSAARAYGNRVIGVVLTGNLDDGSRGLQVIKKLGGLAVVQDPEDALFTSMPSSALHTVAVDHVVPLSEMAELFTQLTREPLTPAEGASNMTHRGKRTHEGAGGDAPLERQGTPSQFICPECSGSLRETEENGLLQFDCHVGHGYSAQTMLEAQSQDVEAAMWTALRALEDYVALQRKLAENASAHGHDASAARYQSGADDAKEHVDILRKVLLGD